MQSFLIFSLPVYFFIFYLIYSDWFLHNLIVISLTEILSQHSVLFLGLLITVWNTLYWPTSYPAIDLFCITSLIPTKPCSMSFVGEIFCKERNKKLIPQCLQERRSCFHLFPFFNISLNCNQVSTIYCCQGTWYMIIFTVGF